MGADGSKEISRTPTPAAGEPGPAEQTTRHSVTSVATAAADGASTLASPGGSRLQQPAVAPTLTGNPPGSGGNSRDDRGPSDEPPRFSEIEEIENLIVMEYQKPSASSGSLSRDRSDSNAARAMLSPRAAAGDRVDADVAPAASDAFDALRFKDANKSPRKQDSRNNSEGKSTPEISKTNTKSVSTKPEPQYNDDEVELLVSIERDLIR